MKAASAPLKLADLLLQKKERGMCLGMTGSGKSTLNKQNRLHFLATYPASRVLIADTKPRFMAEWELNGLKAAHRYRKWDKEEGEFVPGSVRLSLIDPLAEMRESFAQGFRIVIAQVESRVEWWKVAEAIDVFYEHWRAKPERLVEADEVADFFEGGVNARNGNAILRVVRSGRERNVAFQGGSQRPRGLPKSLFAELSKLYLFRLRFEQDIKHIFEFGIPESTKVPDKEHVFYFDSVRQHPGAGRYFTLNLPGGS